MRSSFFRAAFLFVTAVFVSPAHAGDKAFPPYCTIETLVGSAGGSTPTLRVVLRDVNQMPLGGQFVRADFSTNGLRLFAVQDAGVTVNCAARVMSAVSNAAGEVVFHPRFAGTEFGASVRIDANGIVLGSVSARSTDLDAVGGGTGLADFTAFSAAFASGLPHPEVNYDRSGSDLPDLADFTIFAAELSSAAVATYCP